MDLRRNHKLYMEKRTKIICTIGPSVADYRHICQLIDAGMNVARINFSHGTHEDHRKTIEMIKKARREKALPIAIMLDTKGPEIRLGELAEKVIVKKGDRIELTAEEIIGNEKRIFLNPPSVLVDLKSRMNVLIDDGYLCAKVVETSEKRAVIEFKNAGVIQSRKGVNIPHGADSLPAMTEQDKKDIAFGCEMDIDLIAASFIRSAEHVFEIKQLLHGLGHDEIMVIAKIESAQGVQHFESIVQVADGIMVARGDLGVELPLKRVPKLQKVMIRKTYESFKPVITATQMLESMIQNPLPTRAEASDVANAIYDSTSAVMLSGETAVGKYPIEAVKMMREIVEESEKDFDYADWFYEDMARMQFHDISSSVSLATVKTAYSAQASAIFAFTSSGVTAKALARFRPAMPIIAVTWNEKTYHQMAIVWGVTPVLGGVKNFREGFECASCYALQSKSVRYGDLVVSTAGAPFGIAGSTNMMVVDHIGDVLVRGKPRKGERVQGKIAFIRSLRDLQLVSKESIVVLTQCDDNYVAVLGKVKGAILANHPDDHASEKVLLQICKKKNIPCVTRADGAGALLREGQFVTLEPAKGLVFKGNIEEESDVMQRVCHIKIDNSNSDRDSEEMI